MMSTTQNGIFAHKSKQINTIQRQLIADFHPAVKNVAAAGQNLLRAYQSFFVLNDHNTVNPLQIDLSRNHYVYTASLNALAFSSSVGDQEMQKKGKQLEKITDTMKAIQAEQAKWMDFFTNLTLAINHNCENEKERLKTMQIGFSKREKDLSKAVEKRKQMPVELDKFYERELAEIRDQQAQRYQFFVEKHLEMLKHFQEWAHFTSALLEREFGFDGKRKDQQKGNEGMMVAQGHQTAAVEQMDNENSRIHQQQQHWHEQVNDEVQHDQKGIRSSQQQQQVQVQLDGRRLSLLSEHSIPDTLHSQSVDKGIHGKQLLPTIVVQQQPQQQQGLFRPIPLLPHGQQKYRHSLALADAVERAHGQMSAWERQQMASLPPDHQQQQVAMAPVVQQLQQFYSEGPPPGIVQLNRVGLAAEGKSDKFHQFLRPNDPAPSQQQHFHQFAQSPPSSMAAHNKSISPLAINHHHNGGHNSHFGPTNHVRGQSQESNASSGMARSTPPIFAASDYGRLVECTTPFEAQGENQLSLGVGERVWLVKSGTRGWVLGRTENGGRHGWFPAKYLKVI